MVAPASKARFRIGFVFALIAIAMASRSWLLSQPTDKDTPLQPTLSADFDPLLAQVEKIRPLHIAKRPNRNGDWLERFPEGGQSFAQYVQSRNERPLHKDFQGIDIQPLGEFDETQLRILDRTAEFMGHYFGVVVKTLPAKPMGEIPETAQRLRHDTPQVLTTWILDEVLKPAHRPDAIATIALVTTDLWPGNLNWVFGQASINDRVGVWSLHRNGDPHLGDEAFRLCLRRTLKTAMHETGHMLGIPHCVARECCMNGSASREESDRQPLEFCKECQPKIWWTCNADPVQRLQVLTEFCDREGLTAEAKLFRQEWKAMTK